MHSSPGDKNGFIPLFFSCPSCSKLLISQLWIITAHQKKSSILSVGHHLWDKQNHRYKYQTTFVPSFSPENHGSFRSETVLLAHLRFPRNRVRVHRVHRVQRVSRPVLPVPITCWTAPWPVEISQSLVESIGLKWINH